MHETTGTRGALRNKPNRKNEPGHFAATRTNRSNQEFNSTPQEQLGQLKQLVEQKMQTAKGNETVQGQAPHKTRSNNYRGNCRHNSNNNNNHRGSGYEGQQRSYYNNNGGYRGLGGYSGRGSYGGSGGYYNRTPRPSMQNNGGQQTTPTAQNTTKLNEQGVPQSNQHAVQGSTQTTASCYPGSTYSVFPNNNVYVGTQGESGTTTSAGNAAAAGDGRA